LISTDKAVNPSSVMGATKRIGELLVQSVARQYRVAYTSVRFGNVLSSRGSVVPLFRRQLAEGGPITVTHPEATRYFMTIPEAVQLVLQAAVLATPGDTFVLDMGEPVRIVQLARDLIEIHGLRPDHDVEVKFIGQRPGEKLTEELFFSFEAPEPTSHEAIRRVRLNGASSTDPRLAASRLVELAKTGTRDEIVAALREIVVEYRPSGWPGAAGPVLTDVLRPHDPS
jgi:FlaA1/EpsC-like NDP-sugar epimerase